MSLLSSNFCKGEQIYIKGLKEEIAAHREYESQLNLELMSLKGLLGSQSSDPTVVYEQPQHPPNYDTLIKWLYSDRTDRETYVKDTFDCEDFAMRLQKEALEDGLILSIQLDMVAHHAINNAFVPKENKIYFVEPQNDGIWLVGALD